VVGDGRQTVRELVEQVNSDPRRGRGHEKPLTRMTLDEEARRLLAEAGLTADSVLSAARSSSSAPPATSRPAARPSTAPTPSTPTTG